MTSSSKNFSVDQLLKDAEPRSRLSSESEQELYASLRDEWRSVVDKRRHTKWYIGIAATLLVGVLATFYSIQLDAPAPVAQVVVARVEAQFGVEANSRLAQILDNNADLINGQVIRTDDHTRLALDLVGGGKLRINSETAVRLLGKQSVELLSGTIYYDSNDKAPAILDGLYKKNSIVVHTAFGQLTNKGTQFLVDNSREKLVVTVRSGLVDLASRTQAIAIESGNQLVLDLNQNKQVNEVPPYGDSWRWVEQTLPEFDLNQAPLTMLLEWVGHETGREIVFSSSEAMRLAQTSVLVGKVDLLPLDALQLWIETVDLEADVGDKQITIALRQ